MVGKIQAQANDVPVNQWQFAMSFGYGSIETPIANHQNLDIYILPNISYYGERFFIDNTTLGYALYEQGPWFVDVVGKLNEDGLYFKFDNVGALAAVGLDFGRGWSGFDIASVERDVSYLAGIAVNYETPLIQTSVRFYQDISSVHNGSELEVSAAKYVNIADWLLTGEVSITHKSHELLSYYYQLARNESVMMIGTYTPLHSGTNINAKFVADYRLTEQLSFSFSYRQTWLTDEITNSPIVDTDSIAMFFSGVTYTF
ncbi:MipA/OmpV family protein [Thalassotalea maritima]|uniref:MipA/OmpV family protein n=1 Tax=Thalassotalea maritima TaxID=3242416 RepID=UPI003529390E